MLLQDPSTINRQLTDSFTGNVLTIFSVNATSLAKKGAIERMATEALHNSIDVLAVCETWFTSQMTSDLLNINGYKLFRVDRPNRKGGGVCFYVNNDICCEQVASVSPSINVEIVWIRVVYYSVVYYIACCYYPPNPCFTAADFMSQLSADLDRILIARVNCVIIVLGDFNKFNVAFLENQFGLVQCVNDNTHGNNLLDKFFVAILSCIRSKSTKVVSKPNTELY